MFYRKQFFNYCTISDVREEGLTESAATDDRVRTLIKRASKKINLFTAQWFMPIISEINLDGDDSPVLHLPGYVPFVKVDSINIILEKATSERLTGVCGYNLVRDKRELGLINPQDFEISDNGRYLELINVTASEDLLFSSGSVSTVGGEYREFPRGRKNVVVDGVYGFVEDSKDVEAITVTQLNSGDSSVVVDDASLFEQDDVLAFEIIPKQKYRYTICTEVDEFSNTLKFEECQFSMPIGTKVFAHGKIPFLIRYACTRLAVLGSTKVGDVLNGNEIPNFYLTSFVEEKTDEYRYRLDPETVKSYNPGYLTGSTGDGEVDRILQDFVAPISIDVI